MNINSLTKQEAAHIFQAIISADTVFLQALARAAIESSADMHTDMYADAVKDDPTYEVNGDDIRQSACNYVGDCIVDFRQGIEEAIRTLPVNIRIEKALDIKVI